MPACFLPNKRIAIQLDCDKENQNHFYFRALTGADVTELAELHDKLKELGDGKRVVIKIFDTIRDYLTGWKLTDAAGADVPYAPETLIKLLTLGEANELIQKLIGTMRLSEDDRGK
jgi:hypothetical protein